VLDKQTKTRREIEIAVGRRAREDFDKMRELFDDARFEPVRPVEKTRALFHLAWEAATWSWAVDSIDDLGTYLEIEARSPRKAQRDRGPRRILRTGGGGLV